VIYLESHNACPKYKSEVYCFRNLLGYPMLEPRNPNTEAHYWI